MLDETDHGELTEAEKRVATPRHGSTRTAMPAKGADGMSEAERAAAFGARDPLLGGES